MKARCRWYGMVLWCLTAWCQAGPLSVTGASGARGDGVTVGLDDASTTLLEAATIELQFDATVLAYTGATLGVLTSADFLLSTDDTAAASGTLVFSLASAALPLDGAAGALLDVSFTILGAAPLGPTPLTFRCFDFGPGLGCVDYPFAPATGAVTVLASGPAIPAPAPVWLMAVSVPVLLRRRR